MERGPEFVDYYSLLQVSPHCDPKILESAYRHFAKIYHPDHMATADVEKFNELSEAYKILRDPDTRAEYNRFYFNQTDKTKRQFRPEKELQNGDSPALGDAEIHEKILITLYRRRREQANDPGVVGWLLQEMLGCSEDNFEFHIWYLKSKGFIEHTDQGTWAVTIQGVDHVISTSRANLSERLLIAQLSSSSD